MASFKSCASSSSLEPKRGWTHEVFVSFRGEDTRNSFVDHLHAALIQKGIQTFKDDEILCGGKPISPELLKAIDESRIAVVVFSKNYSNSSWCLDELVKIMECHDQKRQKVLPVFYHVDPSDVRGHKSDFATAFDQQHEDKVNKWKKALADAANLSGWHISTVSGGESATINKIVQEILGDIQPRGTENNLIGIESHMKALNSLLNMEAREEVRIIGILGMGGIGKTTIAKALFKRISYKFEGSSFVTNVRQNSESKTGICALQVKILKDVLRVHHGFEIQDSEYGADMIRERFCKKKVLLVFDDVNDVKQIEFLAATHDWFGPGSRIIITTRDEHLLSDANAKYKPDLLSMDQAAELFSKHAFHTNSPPDGYKEVSDRAIRYTGRLPLALKVIGSFFRGRNVDVWKSALDRLAKIPDSEIVETLKLSFDDLNVFEKRIFLDVACFFKGEDFDYVTKVLDSFGFDPVIGISVLIEKSLITISENKLAMHDLIQEMGWQIVHESCPNSRLWQLEEIKDFIKKNKKLKAIEAIVVPCREQVSHLYSEKLSIRTDAFQVSHKKKGDGQYGEKLSFGPEVFKDMKNLRLLDVEGNFTSCEPTFLPDELRWLCWNDYPFSSLPLANMHKLVAVELSGDRIEQLWKGGNNMQNLKFINLQRLLCLTKLPDVSGAPNVERLILSNCKNLVEVHESIGSLKRLVYFKITVCENLKCLPSSLEMDSLETLILNSCSSLERLPEFSTCMIKLSRICLYGCCLLKVLPSAIRHLSNLSSLEVTNCMSLTNIPNSIYELKCLKRLLIQDCQKLEKLPEELGIMDKLEVFDLSYDKCCEGKPEYISFHALTNLCSLRILNLRFRQIGEEDFPKDLHRLSNLELLDMSGNSKLIQLPANISHLSRLKLLDVNQCCRLQSLQGLPSGIQVLKANGCSSLEKIGDLSKEYEWLYKIWLFECDKLLKNIENERYLDQMLKQCFLKKCAALDRCLSIGIPGRKIPSWFKEHEHKSITLKLPSNWQTRIMGFAICVVFRLLEIHRHLFTISFNFEDGEKCIPKWEVDCVNTSVAPEDIGNVWIGYIPFTLFQQKMHKAELIWPHMIEVNLMIDVSGFAKDVLRCAAQVVYKEDMESSQQSNSSTYWNWGLRHFFEDAIICYDS